MKTVRSDGLDPYLTHLRALPFVRAVKAEPPRGAKRPVADLLLRLRTPTGERRLRAEVKRTHLTRPLVEGLLARTPIGARKDLILFAPYVGAEIGRRLRDNGVNYVDAAGNCFLALDRGYFAQVEGRRPLKRAPIERGIRGPGYRVIFAVLARPGLLDVPVRTLADVAGVGKTTAAETLRRLEAEGLVGADRERRHLLRARDLLDRWVTGYATAVRPRLTMGRFRTNDPGPEALEARIECELGDTTRWAWGGGAAAMRLTGYYRGPDTVLHLEHPLPETGKRLRAIPDDDGPLIVLGAPGPIAFEGARERTVHPLLVYTELLATGDERAREAAHELWIRYRTDGA